MEHVAGYGTVGIRMLREVGATAWSHGRDHPYYAVLAQSVDGECRWCGARLSDRRTAYCSTECSWLHYQLLWKQVAKTMLAAYDHTCQRCGAHATAVHHVVPDAFGGPTTWMNLEVLCPACHARSHDAIRRARSARSGRSAQADLSAWL